jgi:NAD(P) transhydrogenase subunit beta
MLTMMLQLTVGAVDLAVAFLFMFGLWRMSSPVTAPSGMFFAGLGMLAAVLASFLYVFTVGATAKPHLAVNIGLAVAALSIGGGVAWWSGKKVALTAMPQLVALFNGMGGGAAGAIAAVELFGNKAQGVTPLIVALIGALIGAVSLSGSLIAWAKLDGVLKRPLRVRGQQVFNAVIFPATIAVGGYLIFVLSNDLEPLIAKTHLIELFFGCSLLMGILTTLPLGGADMLVVISIYNAFTGLAVGLEGFVLQIPALMIAGIVVGASGLLLTLLMAKAMNRSVRNVLFTNFGGVTQHKQRDISGSLKPVEAGDAGIFMRYASSVIVVPATALQSRRQQKLYES